MRDKRTTIIKIFISMCLLLFFIAFPKSTVAKEATLFKVIGYLPDYDGIYVDEMVDLASFTDVNYFSLIPQEEGTLKFTQSGSEEQLQALVEKAHRHDVRVGVSIGGWDLSNHFASATSKKYLDTFIKEMKDFTKKYQLDTIDIDWEYPSEEEAQQFEAFIKKLVKELGDVKLSITVPSGVASNGEPSGRWEKHFTPEALLAADWVNIMSYDAQIPNYPNHSPYELHEANLSYWNEVLGGAKMSHLVAGIPFYGKTSSGLVMTYRQLIAEAKEVPITDEVLHEEELYYINNKETLQKKTETALDLGSGGLMVWAPTMDTKVSSSTNLMKVIFKTLNERDVHLDQSHFSLAETLPETEKKVLHIVRVLSLIVGLFLLAIAISLLTGVTSFLLPDTLKGKRVNKKFLAQLLGGGGVILGGLLILLGTLPIWVSLLYLVLLVGCLIFITQKA